MSYEVAQKAELRNLDTFFDVAQGWVETLLGRFRDGIIMYI